MKRVQSKYIICTSYHILLKICSSSVNEDRSDNDISIRASVQNLVFAFWSSVVILIPK